MKAFPQTVRQIMKLVKYFEHMLSIMKVFPQTDRQIKELVKYVEYY